MKYFLQFFLVLCLLASPLLARVINVPGEYATIQAGIDVSVNGDTVLVAPGEYTEVVTIRDKNIFLTSAEGPDTTHINGRLNIFGTSIDTTCVLRGFRISMHVERPYNNLHPLIYINLASPLILGNIIERYAATTFGAGIRLDTSGAIIRANIVRDNWSLIDGGGIESRGHDITVEGNVVSNNFAGNIPEQGDFGGIYANGLIRYNIISGNIASRSISGALGGGLASSISHSQIYNNTIVGNRALGNGGNGYGGGLLAFASYSGNGFIKNNIIAFNPNGSGVYVELADSAYWNWDYNCLFGNDSADYAGCQPGPHDINADPLFVDRFSGDYHLASNSPCIDAGDPSFPLDPDSTRADIGAYFFDQSVDVEEDGAPTGPYDFTLRQNYPNPFNAQTIISYCLDKEATISLHIYAITGHLVKPLLNKEMQGAGEHNYIWDGRNAKGEMVSTGIYFYELYVDDSRESKAMIMVK
jgi:hypothetical protein